MSVFSFIYFIGIASCGIQGAEKAKQKNRCKGHLLISSYFAALGGGLVRDILLLHVFPVAFTFVCIPDSSTAIISALIYVCILRNHHTYDFMKWFITITDACGLGTFIAIGIDKALEMGTSTLIAILCGIVTSLGGGVISSLLCGLSVQKIITSNIAYRLTSILGSIVYIFWINSGVKTSDAQCAIVIYTSIVALACNQDIKKVCYKRLVSAIRNQTALHPFNLPQSIIIPFIILSQFRRAMYYLHVINQTIIYKLFLYIRRRVPLFCLFHRILQM